MAGEPQPCVESERLWVGFFKAERLSEANGLHYPEVGWGVQERKAPVALLEDSCQTFAFVFLSSYKSGNKTACK